jgi:hypothetical protein
MISSGSPIRPIGGGLRASARAARQRPPPPAHTYTRARTVDVHPPVARGHRRRRKVRVPARTSTSVERIAHGGVQRRAERRCTLISPAARAHT